MQVKMGKSRLTLKPAMLVLLSAVFVGAVSINVLRGTPAAAVSADGYANPHTWRFEARQGAQATLISLGATPKAAAAATTAATPAAAKLPVDAENGFKVTVTQPGPTGDCVYLRNAINLDTNQERRPMRLVFEARSTEKPPFPVTFTVRDSSTLLWSSRLTVDSGNWKTYECPVKLKDSSLLNVVMAMHLGEKSGSIEVKNLRVVEGE